jgi:hypothetical protein
MRPLQQRHYHRKPDVKVGHQRSRSQCNCSYSDRANAGKTNRDAEIKDLWTTWTWTVCNSELLWHILWFEKKQCNIPTSLCSKLLTSLIFLRYGRRWDGDVHDPDYKARSGKPPNLVEIIRKRCPKICKTTRIAVVRKSSSRHELDLELHTTFIPSVVQPRRTCVLLWDEIFGTDCTPI